VSWNFEPRILRMPADGDDAGGAGYDLDAVLAAQGRLIEQRMQLNQLEKERAEFLGNQLEATRKQITMTEDRINQSKFLVDQMKDEKLSTIDQIALAEKLGQQTITTTEALGKLGKDTAEQYSKMMKDFDAQLSAINGKIKTNKEGEEGLKKLQKERLEILEEMQTGQEQFVGKLQDAEKSGTKVAGALGGVASKLGMSAKFSDTMAGKMGDFYAEINKGKGSLTGLTKMMGSKAVTDLAAGAISSLLDKVVQLAIEMDKTSKEFEKANGFTANFGMEISTLSGPLMRAGMSAKDASGAMQGLVNNFSAFNPQAMKTNVNLAKNVAMMNAFGVSTETSTKMLDNFVRAQGMTAEAATNMALKVSYSGQAIGFSAAKMSADFNATYGTLSQFGDGSTEIFLDLQAQAKATGVAIGELVKVAQKFDTFSDAATTVSQLNTVLGTNLSAMELMNADYDDRLNLLREGMMLDGQAFESLDRYTKLYVQNALGVSSAAEAQKLLNMNTAEYAGYKADMEAAQMSQEELNQAVVAAVPIATKLTNALTLVATALMPIITLITLVFEALTEFDALLGGWVIPGLMTYGIYVGVAALGTKGLAASVALLVGPLVIGFVAFQAMNDILAKFFPTLDPLAKGFLAMAFGIGAMAIANTALKGSLGPVAFILSGLLMLLSTQINPLFINFGFHMALGIIAMGIAAKIGGYKLIFLVGALALMFGAVALIIYAFNDLVQSVTTLFALFVDNTDKLFLVGAAIYYLAGAFAAMGLAAALSLASTTMLLAAMTGLGAVLIGLTMVSGALTLDSLAKSIKDIGDGMDKFANGLVKIKSVAAELSNLAGSSFLAFSMEGGKTSAIIAHESTFSAIKSGQISVDVKIPEIKVPKPVVHVYIDGKEIKKTVETIFVRNM
jgi:hypothetical protein